MAFSELTARAQTKGIGPSHWLLKVYVHYKKGATQLKYTNGYPRHTGSENKSPTAAKVATSNGAKYVQFGRNSFRN